MSKEFKDMGFTEDFNIRNHSRDTLPSLVEELVHEVARLKDEIEELKFLLGQ